MYKVLIIGNTSSTGWNLKKGLEKMGCKVDLMFDENPILSGYNDLKYLKPKEYDIVHYNYPFLTPFNFKKYFKYIFNSKNLICHWRGDDLRSVDKSIFIKPFYFILFYLNRFYFFKKAKFHFYSTIDLAWWLRNIPDHKKAHIFSMIDTNKFKPLKIKKKNRIVFNGGGKDYKVHKIHHDDMPKYLNSFKSAKIIPGSGLSPHLLSVTAMECLACGLSVKFHEDKDRNWVIKNASVPVISKKIKKIYDKIMVAD